MNNPFKVRLPNIVFDLHVAAVTEAEISQWRIALKKVQARLSTLETFIPAFLMVLVGIVVWATYTADTLYQPVFFLMGGAVVIAAAKCLSHFLKKRQDTIEALPNLDPLEVTAEPEKYIALAQWCAQDAVLVAYQKGWTEQKRLPLAGEYAVIKRWVEGTESRMKKAQMVEQAYAACDVLVGMSVQK